MTDIAEHRCTEAKHTPGPWFVNPVNAWVEIPDVDAPICALLWPTELRSEDETFANGMFIVRACNNHAALVALAIQYRDDLRYPPTADSIPRRLAAIEAVFVKLEI